MKTSSFVQYKRGELRPEFTNNSFMPPLDYGAIDAPRLIPAGSTIIGKYSELPIQTAISREQK